MSDAQEPGAESRRSRELRALVVDDSAYNRGVVSELLTKTGRVRVVGRAADGEDALAQVERLKPDLVTLDLEMPRMDGFGFLREVMRRSPVPVIVVSGFGTRDNVFRALELGAVDFISKPGPEATHGLEEIADLLRRKVRMVQALSMVNINPSFRTVAVRRRSLSSVLGPVILPDPHGEPARVVVIAASTGGPPALLELVSKLPGHTSLSIVIAQHMPEHFTSSFSQRLNRASRLQIAEAAAEQTLQKGTAYVCPGAFCVEIVRVGGVLQLRTEPPRPEDRYVPSADRLFASAAREMGARAVGIVLTGMGSDGAVGVSAIRQAGGVTIAEAPETALVYGMPNAAVQTGAVQHVLPLTKISEYLNELISHPAAGEYHR